VGSHTALGLSYIAESMPVFALSDMTQRASLLLTVALVLGVGACSGDSNGALFTSSPDVPRHDSGGSSPATASGGDSSGGTGNSGSTSASGGSSQAGSTNSGGVATADTGGNSAQAGDGSGSGTGGGTTAAGGSRATGGKAATGGGGGDPVADAGSGGSETDSGPGAGGAPPVDSGGSPGGFTGDGKIRCGDSSCDKSAGEICCIKDSTQQRTTATCAANAQGCARVFRCDSDGDCAHGEHCCMEFPNALNTPSTSCVARACDSPLACSVPADCASGESCCGVIGQGPATGVRYTSVACQQRCDQGTAFCADANSSCRGNTSCQQSQTLPPGYLVCR